MTKLADELESLAEKATPGPWNVEQIDYSAGLDRSFELNAKTMRPVAQTIMREIRTEGGRSEIDEANLHIIASLRNNLPAIITALRDVERLREALQEAYSALDSMMTDSGRRTAAMIVIRAALAKAGE